METEEFGSGRKRGVAGRKERGRGLGLEAEGHGWVESRGLGWRDSAVGAAWEEGGLLGSDCGAVGRRRSEERG